MRLIFSFLLLISVSGFGQWKDFTINSSGDTMNRVDMQGRKQGPWIHRYETVRGEPGYEEEGYYKNDKKEGEWKLFSLMGDLVGIENYRWGMKDGVCRYFSSMGDLRLEQSWIAINPEKQYDTIMVEDLDKLDSYRKVVVKNEGASLKHGIWRYYNSDGGLIRSEKYEFGKLETPQTAPAAPPAAKKETVKPKEVLEFEKKNEGKKKIKVRDGGTGGA
ncbi:MAG: hypothetical protein K2P88_16255 [Chitinophagaceae bacterium]|uniref:toxin-antitoxin system YwqK family antitoxin n=1 Tax=unclassified Paraflavitalea TaxID=2798305 RepID=UPI003D346F83|nr:hypothetical protein [Chitinophagaceae bacterium]